jgi:hypothetical protein
MSVRTTDASVLQGQLRMLSSPGQSASPQRDRSSLPQKPRSAADLYASGFSAMELHTHVRGLSFYEHKEPCPMWLKTLLEIPMISLVNARYEMEPPLVFKAGKSGGTLGETARENVPIPHQPLSTVTPLKETTGIQALSSKKRPRVAEELGKQSDTGFLSAEGQSRSGVDDSRPRKLSRSTETTSAEDYGPRPDPSRAPAVPLDELVDMEENHGNTDESRSQPVPPQPIPGSPTATAVSTEVDDGGASTTHDNTQPATDEFGSPLLYAPRGYWKGFGDKSFSNSKELLRLREGPGCIVSLRSGNIGKRRNVKYVSKSWLLPTSGAAVLKGMFTEVNLL